MFTNSKNNMSIEEIEIFMKEKKANVEEKLSKIMVFEGTSIYDNFMKHYETLAKQELSELLKNRNVEDIDVNSLSF